MTRTPILAVTVALVCGCLPMPVSRGLHAAQQSQVSTDADVERIPVTLTDPSRPVQLEVQAGRGSITVRGSDRRDIVIEARVRGSAGGRGRNGRSGDPGTTTGLRRLTQLPSFAVEEDNNRVSVNSGFGQNRALDFDIQVPTRTSVRLQTMNDGAIAVENLDGELEVNNLNGPITLTRVAGSVVAHTLNGRVLATITRITAQKAMAFTTLNGTVDVTLPASLKADFKLRSDQGDIFTDFDLQMKPAASSVQDTRREGGRYRIEVNRAIAGSVNGGGPEIEIRTHNGNIFVRKGA
jgi:DUF4097 and DUF4098 domain-containing protein YvlB